MQCCVVCVKVESVMSQSEIMRVSQSEIMREIMRVMRVSARASEAAV